MTPKFICRAYLIFRILGKIKKKLGDIYYLDAGCGEGDFIELLEKKGYKGEGFDFSEDAVQKAKKRFQSRVKITKKDLYNLKGRKYNLVLLLEVLEHIKDEMRVLKSIRNIMQEEGYLILSVPARKNKWGLSDKYNGHYRRYEKRDLRELLKKGGFEIELLYSYGFPLCNISKFVREFRYMSRISKEKAIERRTKRSGYARENTDYIFNEKTLKPFNELQNFFLKKDLGVGYLVLCSKSLNDK